MRPASFGWSWTLRNEEERRDHIFTERYDIIKGGGNCMYLSLAIVSEFEYLIEYLTGWLTSGWCQANANIRSEFWKQLFIFLFSCVLFCGQSKSDLLNLKFILMQANCRIEGCGGETGRQDCTRILISNISARILTQSNN